MAAKKKNNSKNVSGSKGVEGGYAFWAPLGTELPTDYKTPLPEAFENIGYVGEDGISFSDSIEGDEIKDANGDVCDKSTNSKTSTMVLKLIEVRKATQAVQYGAGNVTDEGGMLTVHHKLTEGDHGVIVLEVLLKGGRKMRRVVPDAQRTELGDEVLISPDVFAREATFTLYKDPETGDYKTDYIESTETTAAVA